MMGYVHKETASPFITVQKDEGIQPAEKPLHFLFTVSRSLFQYKIIPYTVMLHAFFYRGNTMGKYYG